MSYRLAFILVDIYVGKLTRLFFNVVFLDLKGLTA